jgi:hypothetical protein
VVLLMIGSSHASSRSMRVLWITSSFSASC